MGQLCRSTIKGVRSLGKTCREILAASYSPELARRLGHTPRSRTISAAGVDDETPAFLKQECELVKLAFSFAANLASHHAWSNLQYRMALPQAMAGLLLVDDERGRKRCMDTMKQIVLAVESAERMVAGLLDDVGWRRTQLARECMAYLLKEDFDHTSEACIKLANKLFGVSHSTHAVLESAFSYLRFRVGKQSKNDKMSDPTRYAYSAQPVPKGIWPETSFPFAE